MTDLTKATRSELTKILDRCEIDGIDSDSAIKNPCSQLIHITKPIWEKDRSLFGLGADASCVNLRLENYNLSLNIAEFNGCCAFSTLLDFEQRVPYGWEYPHLISLVWAEVLKLGFAQAVYAEDVAGCFATINVKGQVWMPEAFGLAGFTQIIPTITNPRHGTKVSAWFKGRK